MADFETFRRHATYAGELQDLLIALTAAMKLDPDLESFSAKSARYEIHLQRRSGEREDTDG